MAFVYDCFVSYSHKNLELAQRLTGWLEQAGLKVWRDNGRLAGGDPVNAAILEGLDASRHFVCLVSDAWHSSDYTQWELEAFLESAVDERQVVPVFLGPRDVRRLGPRLARLKGIHWSSAYAPDEHATLWQLFCALSDAEIGPEGEWSARGKALLDRLPAGYGGVRITGLPDGAPPSAVQWSTPRGDRQLGGDAKPWDGELVHARPGLVRIELITPELYDIQTADVIAGVVTAVRLEPSGVTWPSLDSVWHKGTGEAADTKLSVLYGPAQARTLAARIGFIANRVLGITVRVQAWGDFREDGDGSIERFASVNTVFYREEERGVAQTLQSRLREARPPIRVAMHQGGFESTTHMFGGAQVQWGFGPKTMMAFLVEVTGG